MQHIESPCESYILRRSDISDTDGLITNMFHFLVVESANCIRSLGDLSISILSLVDLAVSIRAFDDLSISI